MKYKIVILYVYILKLTLFLYLHLGQSEIVCLLLNNCLQLEIDARNCMGFTSLMKAALQGRTKCAKFLLYAGTYCLYYKI